MNSSGIISWPPYWKRHSHTYRLCVQVQLRWILQTITRININCHVIQLSSHASENYGSKHYNWSMPVIRMGNPLQWWLCMVTHGLWVTAHSEIGGGPPLPLFSISSPKIQCASSVWTLPPLAPWQWWLSKWIARMSGLLSTSSGVHYPWCQRRVHYYWSQWWTNSDCSVSRLLFESRAARLQFDNGYLSKSIMITY